MIKANLVTIAILGLSLIAVVHCASQCYKCGGLDCANMELDACPSNRAICQKMITRTGNVSVYVKSCTDQCIDDKEIVFGPTTITYKCCEKDLCNSANSGYFKATFLTGAFILLAVKAIYYS